MSRKITARATRSRDDPEQHEHVGHHHPPVVRAARKSLHPEVHDPGKRQYSLTVKCWPSLRDQAPRVGAGMPARRGKRATACCRPAGLRSLVRRTRQSIEHPDEQADGRRAARPAPGPGTRIPAGGRLPSPCCREHHEFPGTSNSAYNTTTASAPRSRKASFPCPRGSRRAIVSERELPTAADRGGNPEDRELYVPGAHQVERERRGRDFDAEESWRSRRDNAGKFHRRCI